MKRYTVSVSGSFSSSGYIFIASILFILVSFSNSCKSRTVYSDEIEQITCSIHSLIGWAQEKDTSLLYSVVAKESNLLEVHPNGRVVIGFEQFREGEKFWMSDDFRAIRYEIRDLKITISNSGEVAWFFCILDDINEWKGRPANWENTCWTGVLEKENGKWKLKQQHFSFQDSLN